MLITISPSKNQNIEGKDALHFFTGLVFKQLDLLHYTKEQLDYAYKNIVILSETKGYILPHEKVLPHRPELPAKRAKELLPIVSEFLASKNQLIFNLASLEYSALLPSTLKMITPDFKGMKSVHIKKTRGMMLDYCIKNMLEKESEIKTTILKFFG
jgi:cytoplasmic iron level regulating protein YaaA (DUF328/UPF0246 family)